jgi:hypothetical protein
VRKVRNGFHVVESTTFELHLAEHVKRLRPEWDLKVYRDAVNLLEKHSGSSFQIAHQKPMVAMTETFERALSPKFRRISLPSLGSR